MRSRKLLHMGPVAILTAEFHLYKAANHFINGVSEEAFTDGSSGRLYFSSSQISKFFNKWCSDGKFCRWAQWPSFGRL